MKLQYRILVAQLPALIVVVLLLVFGGATVQRLGEQGRSVLAANYRSVVAAQRMKESIERLDSAALFRLSGSPERTDALVREHRPAFEAELVVEEGNLTEAGEAEVVADLRREWAQYGAAYERFLAADDATAGTIYFSELLPTFEAIKENANGVLDLNQDAMVRKSDEASERAEEALRAWLLASVVGLGGAVTLGVLLARRLAGPLRALSATAERVGEGHLDVRLPRTRIEELDGLAAAFNTMADRLRLYRRAADSELARAREAAQAAIESLSDPVLVLTIKGEVRATNGAARRVLGIDPRARRLDGTDPDLLRLVDDARAKVVDEGRPVTPADFSSVVVVTAPEGERAFLSHAMPINDGVTGELVGVTVLLQDVTRLRHLDELKGNLVNTVAHELRTPLTSLGMAMHLALDERVSGPVSPTLSELLVTARDDVRRMRALVEDLLDLSRIQEGRMVTQREPVAASALLDEVVAATRGPAEAAGVTVRIAATPDAPVPVDRPRLLVALTNLVVNAIRHSPRGAAIELRAEDVEGGLRFTVEDRGPGVAEADRVRIFEPFVRGEGETSPGAGLGLYIAREVARAHGGRIGVEPGTNGGARFWLEVPR